MWMPAHAAGVPAIISRNEKGNHRELAWPELRRQVASLALHLKAQGVQPGDRVAAYLPNVPETMVAFLATVSIGGVWSLCAPDMGTHAVLDRFRQIEPKVLIAVDGVTYAGRDHDRLGVLAELRAQLPSVQHTLLLGNLNATVSVAGCASWTSATGQNDHETDAFEPLWLPFDHPLWIVYSSGTTGLPKPIVHGHGGMVLVQLQLGALHNDLGCSYAPNSRGERYHWYSSTGWVMWNAQVGGLLAGTTCVIFDGNPGGSKEHPDWALLWRFASETGVTFFGAGAAFFANCMKAGITPRSAATCPIRALGSTGSPLSAEVQQWGTDFMAQAGVPDIWWSNISGGTDFAGAFIGGHRELPQVPGKMQCRMLGAAVEAWDEQGEPVLDAVGELVCTQPIPSMPLYLWGDEQRRAVSGELFRHVPGGPRPPARRRRRPGQHGRRLAPWRLDAHRHPAAAGRLRDLRPQRRHHQPPRPAHGHQRAVQRRRIAARGARQMVVDLEYLGRESYMPLFVVLREGHVLDDALRARSTAPSAPHSARASCPTRFCRGRRSRARSQRQKAGAAHQETAAGPAAGKGAQPDAMANPGCLDWYVDFAAQHQARA
jgi:acetoacetyl-CoA synthetase